MVSLSNHAPFAFSTPDAADAVTILNTPSWRVSAWRRTPTASLLAAPQSEPIAASPATDADEAKTHVSAKVH